MTLLAFPYSSTDRGPRCKACLRFVPDRKYVDSDTCDETCISGLDIRTMGEPPHRWGHLHWRCECGFTWATMTAEQSGHDADRQ